MFDAVLKIRRQNWLAILLLVGLLLPVSQYLHLSQHDIISHDQACIVCSTVLADEPKSLSVEIAQPQLTWSVLEAAVEAGFSFTQKSLGFSSRAPPLFT